jgi:hypothetical protein
VRRRRLKRSPDRVQQLLCQRTRRGADGRWILEAGDRSLDERQAVSVGVDEEHLEAWTAGGQRVRREDFKGGSLRSPPGAGCARPQAVVLAGRHCAARHDQELEENHPPRVQRDQLEQLRHVAG